jgi:hypothetical protein
MKPEEWIKDPVFQLNLLLWMAREQPDDAYLVYPLFARHGFEWLAVEQPFTFPVATNAAIEAAMSRTKMRIHRHPEPELILKRDRDQSALYFEAKKSSFTSISTNSSQARGHLLAIGPPFAEVQTPLKTATLTYVVPFDQSERMRVCLGELTVELQAAGLIPGPYSVACLAVEDAKLDFRLDPVAKSAIGCGEDCFALMHDLDDVTDPSPLMLVFSAEDCADQDRVGYYRHVLQQQVLAALLCRLHTVPGSGTAAISAAEILRETTQGAFDYLGPERQKHMEVLVKENVFATIRDYWNDRASGLATLKGRELTVSFGDPAKRDEFFDWLESRKTKFPDTAPTLDAMEQLDLFESR